MKVKVVWGLRVSNIEFSDFEWVAKFSFHLSAWLSRHVDMIIINSKSDREHHIACGYAAQKIRTIPNGIDTDRFLPRPELKSVSRSRLGIRTHQHAVGLVGRMHPMKGYEVFLNAAGVLVSERDDVCFDEPGVRDVMNSDCGTMCNAGNCDAFADAIINILATDEKSNLNEHCRNYAMRFSWDAIAEQYLDLYKSLI